MKNIFTVFSLLLLGQFYKGMLFPIKPQKETLPKLIGIEKFYAPPLWETPLETTIFQTKSLTPSQNLRAPGVPSPLPFYTDFTSNEFTFVNGQQPNKWVWGNAVGNTGASMYISEDNGVSNTYNTGSSSITHAYKDLIIPAGTTIASISFDWRALGEGTTGFDWDYVRVFLAPASFTPTAGTAITANNSNRIIQLVEGLRGQDTWTTFVNATVNVSSFAGSNMRLIFQWRNDSSAGDNPPGAIDNVRIEIPTCISPTNMSVSNQTLNSATLNWNAVSPTPAQGYEYFISTNNTTPTNTTNGTTVTSTSVDVSNLTPSTQYFWWVRSKCVGNDRGFWMAGQPFVLGQIGSGTTYATALPVSTCWGYSYSQSIYTTAEVQSGVGNNRIIKKISYYVHKAPTNQNASRSWKVFLGNTAKTNFANSSDWIPNAQLVKVFDGNIPDMVTGRWLEINLDVPFIWDGTSNLVIAVDENSPSYSCSDWGTYSAGAGRGMVYRSDSENPDPASPPSANSRLSAIPRLLLGADPLPPCTASAPTNVVASNISDTSAMLTWNPVNTTEYLLQWRKVTSPASGWTTIAPNPPASYYLLTGLEEQTNYEFRVAYICGGNTGAFSAPVPFTTKPLVYCSAQSTNNPVNDYIENVTISPTGFPQLPAMNSNTGASNYSDFYFDNSKKVSLVKGSTGNSISVRKAFAGNASNVAVSAWIDFNRDGIFDNAELVFGVGANNTLDVNGTFDVPAVVTNSPFPTRMRVTARRSSSPLACDNFANGEVEDYAVVFVDPIPCNNTPQNATVNNITSTTATVNWTADPGGASYVIRYKVAGTNTWIDQIPAASLQSSLALNNLTPSTNYEVHISAICAGVEGTPVVIPFTTPCNAVSPSNFVINQITSTSAVASWNSLPLATYTFQYRAVGATNWTTINQAGTSYTMTNLLPYVTYEARVSSMCGGIASNFSTPEVFRTLPTCDMPPVELTITKLTMTEARLQWRDIPNATYVLQWRKVGSNAGWNTVNVNTNTYTLTGLTEQTRYEVKVANVCNGTQNPFTNVYEFTTPSLLYCNMATINNGDDYIANVTINATGYEEMTNSSNASGYTSYVNQPSAYVKLDRGSQNNHIVVQKAWKGIARAGAVTVWIDFNRDSQFSNDERILIAPVNTQETAEATFNVPMNSFASTSDELYTVMRVAFSRGESPAMCENAQYGEVEDYRVVLSPVNQFLKLNPEEINIYPVPVSTTMNITLVNDGSKYTIYNTAGQVVQTGQIFNNKIDVSRILSGVYMIEIESTSTGRSTKKFIKN